VPRSWRHPNVGENETMILWPAVALIGFLVLTALVIAMGIRSTALYEREQQSTAGVTAPEQVGALAA
jgi:multisubunit Na+/H+ antiporter MnhC subunit